MYILRPSQGELEGPRVDLCTKVMIPAFLHEGLIRWTPLIYSRDYMLLMQLPLHPALWIVAKTCRSSFGRSRPVMSLCIMSSPLCRKYWDGGTLSSLEADHMVPIALFYKRYISFIAIPVDPSHSSQQISKLKVLNNDLYMFTSLISSKMHSSAVL